MPSLNTWPTSMAWRSASVALHRGQGSPSMALRRSANRSTSKSRCRFTPVRCASAALAPVTALAMCWTSRSARMGIFSFMPTGPGETDRRAGHLLDHLRRGQFELRRLPGAANLPLVGLVIAADQHGDRLAVGQIDQRLDEVLRLALQELADLLDRAGAGRGHLLQRRQAGRSAACNRASRSRPSPGWPRSRTTGSAARCLRRCRPGS